MVINMNNKVLFYGVKNEHCIISYFPLVRSGHTFFPVGQLKQIVAGKRCKEEGVAGRHFSPNQSTTESPRFLWLEKTCYFPQREAE